MEVKALQKSREEGVVSLLTVIFFMVFASLIVVGFVSIVVADQRQTTDNDLSASALAAARGGVEDGKRILLYCASNPAATGCSALDNTSCDAFTKGDGNTLASTKLGINFDSTTGEGMTGGSGASAYQQYFSCLTINTKPQSISSGPLAPDNDYIRPLTTVAPFNNLKVSWSGDESFSLTADPISNGWPTLASWNSVPVVRLQVIPYNGFSNLDDLEYGTRTIYIVPCDSANLACRTKASLTDINAIDARVDINSSMGALRASAAPITYAQCTKLSTYSCTITLAGFNGGPGGAFSYYIRASVLYGTTTLTFSPYYKDPISGASSQVSFDNVQPTIDVTGRTNDVYKRVRAEVGYEPTVPLPSDTLTSAAPICKDMKVTNDVSTTTYNCN